MSEVFVFHDKIVFLGNERARFKAKIGKKKKKKSSFTKVEQRHRLCHNLDINPGSFPVVGRGASKRGKRSVAAATREKVDQRGVK